MKNFLSFISWILRGYVIFSIIKLSNAQDFPIAIFSLVLLVISFFPLLIRNKSDNVDIVSLLEVLYLITVALHNFGLNTDLDLYKHPRFDDILHVLMGGFLGGLTFSIMYAGKQLKKINLPTLLIIIFSISLSLSIGVLWEFYEYLWDIYITSRFGYVVAQVNLTDTMSDLFIDIFGSGVASIILYFVSKTKNANGFLIEPFRKIFR